MSYSDEWFANLQHRRGIERRWLKGEPVEQSKPVEPWPVTVRPLEDPPPCGEHSTTWKPWAEMTAEERRKALSQREKKP